MSRVFNHIDEYPKDSKRNISFGNVKDPIGKLTKCVVTRDGRVWDVYTMRWVNISADGRVCIRGNRCSAKKLIAIAFLPNPNSRKYVICKDDDDTNLSVDNLYWSHGILNIIGKRYGRLVVLDSVSANFVKCGCDCGKICVVNCGSMRYGGVTSCGCYHKDIVSDIGKANITHGYEGTPLYRKLTGMYYRCYCSGEESSDYRSYKSKGITVCDDWNKDVVGLTAALNNFISWAKNNGYREGLEIDRIDNDGNYEPGNCRWATRKEQMRNVSDNVEVMIGGIMCFIPDIAKKYNLSVRYLYKLVSDGKDIEQYIKNKVGEI